MKTLFLAIAFVFISACADKEPDLGIQGTWLAVRHSGSAVKAYDSHIMQISAHKVKTVVINGGSQDEFWYTRDGNNIIAEEKGTERIYARLEGYSGSQLSAEIDPFKVGAGITEFKRISEDELNLLQEKYGFKLNN